MGVAHDVGHMLVIDHAHCVILFASCFWYPSLDSLEAISASLTVLTPVRSCAEAATIWTRLRLSHWIAAGLYIVFLFLGSLEAVAGLLLHRLDHL